MARPNDMTRLTDGIAASYGSRDDFSADDAPPKAARMFIHETHRLVKPAADAMAADTTAYTAAEQIRARAAGILIGAYFIPEAALTADNTNFATLEVQKADGAGGAGTNMASVTTKITDSGDFAAGKIVTLTLDTTIANRRFAKGSVLGFAIAKAAAGVAVPKGQFVLDVEWEDVDGYPV